MIISKEEFKKLFPNLAKELEENTGITLKIDKSRGYNLTVIDFIKDVKKMKKQLKL